MKRIIFKLGSFMIVVGLILPAFTTKIHALNNDPTRDKLRKTVFISNNTSEQVDAFSEGLTVIRSSDYNDEDLIVPNVIVVNYEEIVDDKNVIDSLASSLMAGDTIYLRTNNSQVDSVTVKSMFGSSDVLGRFRPLDEYVEDMVVYGYIVFYDEMDVLQAVESSVGYINSLDSVRGNTRISAFSFSDELDVLNNFLSLDLIDSLDYGTQSQTRAATLSKVEPKATQVWRADVTLADGKTTKTVNIGQVTVTLYADRLNINRNSNTWNNMSIWTTQWAYRASVHIQPLWKQSDDYRSLNKLLKTYYTTHPGEQDSGTYGMMLLDYGPGTDCSGVTNVQMSIGVDMSVDGLAICPGYSISTSYPDILIENSFFRSKQETNYAQITFNIGTPNSPKTVNKSSIALESGVVAINYSTSNNAIQFGYLGWWYVNQGSNWLGITQGFDVYKSYYWIWEPFAPNDCW